MSNYKNLTEDRKIMFAMDVIEEWLVRAKHKSRTATDEEKEVIKRDYALLLDLANTIYQLSAH